MMNYHGKGEFQYFRSLFAKVDDQYKKDKADLLRTMAAADMNWAWGSGRKDKKK